MVTTSGLETKLDANRMDRNLIVPTYPSGEHKILMGKTQHIVARWWNLKNTQVSDTTYSGSSAACFLHLVVDG